MVDGEWNMEWILSKKTRTSYTQIQTDGTNWIHVQIYIVVWCGEIYSVKCKNKIYSLLLKERKKIQTE